MRYAQSMMKARPRFLLNRSIPAVAGPKDPFKTVEKPLAGLTAANQEVAQPKAASGGSPVSTMEESTKPLSVVPQPGAMPSIDPAIQTESNQVASQIQNMGSMKNPSIMASLIKNNLDFIARLKAKFQEARDSLQDPALAEKYQNMMDDHLAMNKTLQNAGGAGAMEKMVLS